MPLSVVIPSYSRADLLTLCLRSVTHFAPVGTEIIVVDDGSPNGAISNAASRFAGVRVVRLSKRSGFCLAANAGIAAASGDVVELLNDDTEVTPGWAEAALRWFDNPRIAAVAPLVLQLDPTRRERGLPPLIDSAGDEYDFGGFARKRGHGSLWIIDEKQTTPVPVWGASAAAAFFRRSAILAAGGFPSNFGAYFEDVDLSFRIRQLGHEIWHDPASVVWHRVSASYERNPPRRILEQQSCNEERVFWRNVRCQDRRRYFPRHLAVLAGKGLRRMEEGALAPWLMGRIRAWVMSAFNNKEECVVGG